jgi:Ni2+-binding GTPase involved in maturation of urease and hydrogenase
LVYWSHEHFRKFHQRPPPISVSVLTGFLGAGKATLLNRILTEQHEGKLAVIENEFGEAGMDNPLVVQSEEALFEMSNGCICRSARALLLRHGPAAQNPKPGVMTGVTTDGAAP